MTDLNDGMRFVVDTHALWWYFKVPTRLSTTASDIFRMALADKATIIVPAIVVAEFYFLSIKSREPFTPSELIDTMKVPIGFEFSSLGESQLEKLDDLQEIPEMHDRLIAAESMILDAPLITRDGTLADSPQIETVW